MKILLVEDDPVQSAAFGDYLARAGHEVDRAAGRQAAFGMLASGRYDAAAIDLVLAVSTGDTVAETACRQGLGVVVMSAAPQATLDDLVAALSLRGVKVHAALPKPFTPQVLLLALEGAARKARGEAGRDAAPEAG